MFMGKNYGKLRLYADRATGRLLGAAMCVTGGEHLAHLVAWCIEQELTVLDLQRMPYYHPTLEEGLASAVEDLASKRCLLGQNLGLDLSWLPYSPSCSLHPRNSSHVSLRSH